MLTKEEKLVVLWREDQPVRWGVVNHVRDEEITGKVAIIEVKLLSYSGSCVAQEIFDVVEDGKLPRLLLRKNSPTDSTHSPWRAVVPDKADEPARPLQATVEPDHRMVVNIGPEKLCAFFKGITTAQGNRLVKPYLDKWIRISGTVSNIGDTHMSFRNFAGMDLLIVMFFDDNCLDRLSVLNKGDTVNVLGQLREVEEFGLQLRHCELV